MFERYTQSARRTIFFARYEATQRGSAVIEPLHLLLALSRGTAPILGALLPDQTVQEQLRDEVEAFLPAARELGGSVDLPLSSEMKHVLAYTAEESDGLDQRTITCAHMLAALLRVSKSAAQVLEKHGIDLGVARRAAAGWTD